MPNDADAGLGEHRELVALRLVHSSGVTDAY
jgi:hypothetical protein